MALIAREEKTWYADLIAKPNVMARTDGSGAMDRNGDGRILPNARI